MKDLINKIRNTRDFENLDEIIGNEIGSNISKVFEEIENEKSFEDGLFYSLYILAVKFNEPTMAKHLLLESGYDMTYFKMFDNYDLVLKTISIRG